MSMQVDETNNFLNIPIKIYPNGQSGHYLCRCIVCNKLFYGDKRDLRCPDHEK